MLFTVCFIFLFFISIMLDSPKISCASTGCDIGDRDVSIRCAIIAKPRLTALFWIVDGNGTTISDGDFNGVFASHSKVRRVIYSVPLRKNTWHFTCNSHVIHMSIWNMWYIMTYGQHMWSTCTNSWLRCVVQLTNMWNRASHVDHMYIRMYFTCLSWGFGTPHVIHTCFTCEPHEVHMSSHKHFFLRVF